MSPNDLKLSDCGARRAGCGKVAGGERSEAAGAASVTRGAVRCSAWLGVMGLHVEAHKQHFCALERKSPILEILRGANDTSAPSNRKSCKLQSCHRHQWCCRDRIEGLD